MGSERSNGASADELESELEQLVAEEVATLIDRLRREVLGEPDAKEAATGALDPAPQPPAEVGSKG